MNASIRTTDTAGAKPVAVPPKFVHLKVHSAYSLLEGALIIPKLAKLAVASGMPALGLTDTSNMFGALEFSDKLAGAGVQPIAGVSLAIDFCEAKKDDTPRKGPAGGHAQRDGMIALYAMDEVGYANLMKLASRAHLGTADVEPPHIKRADLEKHAAGCIVLSGGPDGPINRALIEGQTDVAAARLQVLQRLFGDRLYIELQRHGLKHELDAEPQLIDLAYAQGIPLVATNECYFGVGRLRSP